MLKGFIVTMTVFLAAACTMPETKIYSLALPEGKETSDVKAGAAVNIFVHSPRYLSQAYIAYRTSPYQLQISRYSKWDSSPDEMVREAFKDSLSSSSLFREVRTSNFASSGYHSFEVHLRRFERSDEGNDSFGELVFDVSLLSPEGKELYRCAVSRKVRLEDKSFLGLAKALSAALSEGIGEMKAGLVKALPAGLSF